MKLHSPETSRSSLSSCSCERTARLIFGPSSCGKTYTSQTASRLAGVAFVHEDMTRFSEVGYVGQDAADILLDLLQAAGGNPRVAQMGIVYLDEIDKIATEMVAYKDVSGRGVQKGLLHLVDGTENTVHIGKERISLSTKHVLFIAGGAFENLETLVKKRLARQGYQGNWKDHLLTEALVAFGMERQLMGRFPVRVVRRSTELTEGPKRYRHAENYVGEESGFGTALTGGQSDRTMGQ